MATQRHSLHMVKRLCVVGGEREYQLKGHFDCVVYAIAAVVVVVGGTCGCQCCVIMSIVVDVLHINTYELSVDFIIMWLTELDAVKEEIQAYV